MKRKEEEKNRHKEIQKRKEREKKSNKKRQKEREKSLGLIKKFLLKLWWEEEGYNRRWKKREQSEIKNREREGSNAETVKRKHKWNAAKKHVTREEKKGWKKRKGRMKENEWEKKEI